MHFLAPQFLWLLLLLPVVVWLFVRSSRRESDARAAFGGTAGARIRGLRSVLVLLGLLALCIALARPAWDRVPTSVSRGGRDVLFLLDVSRSMLAADLAPDRLGAAKRAILDCVETFEGNRVGLVTFAGSPSTVCPLTTDYGYFRQLVEEASPENVDHGGTRIGDAIRRTVDKLLDPRRAGLQDIVLLSDGGDQESEPHEAAAELDEYGVFLIAIGLGDDVTGARVPARRVDGVTTLGGVGFTMHQGQEIWSRLEPESLRAMASAAKGGVYLHAATKNLELGRVYHDLVRHLQNRNPSMSESMLRWREEFLWFLAIALSLLLLDPLLRLLSPLLQSKAKGAGAATVLVVSFLFSGAVEAEAASASDARERYNEGVDLHGDGDFPGAISAFREALNKGGAAGSRKLALRASYNLGLAHFALAESQEGPVEILDPEDEEYVEPPDPISEYQAAASAFRACLEIDPKSPDAAWNLELSLRRAQQLTEEGEGDTPETDMDEAESEEGEAEDSDSMPSDDEEFGDDWEESEEEGDGTPSDYQSSQSAMDLQNQDIPPPMVDPQELLMEEQANSELREKSRSKSYQPVDKDW